MQSREVNLTRARARIFKALSDPARLKIIEFLRDGEKCVCEIIPHVNMVQPLVSRHLKILKDCGLVKDRKDGNWRHYSVTDTKIFKIVDAVSRDLVGVVSAQVVEEAV
jgi:ArsR family transcriptional regulator